MRFLPDERGQSIQIGAVLLFAVLIILLALWQAIVVPNQNEEVEFNHNEDLQQQMTELRSTVNSMPDAQTTRSVTLDLGVRYPSRSIFRNPPPVRGSLRTVGGPSGELRATIDNASAVDMEGETGDFWNGTSKVYGTRSIQYEPAYNEYSNAPRTIYEHSVLFNKFDTEQQDLAVTGQALVRGERLTLIAVNGSLSESRVDSASVDFVPLSTETESVEVRPDGGPITLELPTRLSQGEWRTLFETVETVDTSNVTVNESAFPDDDDLGLLRVTLAETDSAGDTRTYTLRLAKIGLGTGTTTTEPAYVTDVAGNDSVIQTGETQPLTVEVRDKFNRPLSGVTVNASAEGGVFANNADTTATTTVTDGEATLQYTGQVTGTNAVNVTIDEGYQPVPGGNHVIRSPTNLTMQVTVESPPSVGSGGGSGAYNVTWLDPAAGNPNVSCSEGPPKATCTIDANQASSYSQTLTMETDPTADGADVTYDVSNQTVGTLSPKSGTTDSNGVNSTTLTVTNNGTINTYTNSGSSGDRIEFTVINVTSDDTTAPSISNFAATNPSGTEVEVSFDSDEPLSTIDVGVTNSTGYSTNITSFSETANGDGSYTYTGSVDVGGTGDYTAVLNVAEDDAGNDGASGQGDTVTVGGGNSAPTASFTFSPSEPEPGETVTFDASGSIDSDGTIQSYDWDFGDGSTGTGEVVDHVYSSPGSYTVTLTVTDNDGSTDTATETVRVRPRGLITAVGPDPDELSDTDGEFIRVNFNEPTDTTDWKLVDDESQDTLFPSETVDGTLYFARNTSAFTSTWGVDPSRVYQLDLQLANAGEPLELVDDSDTTVDEFAYVEPGGSGIQTSNGWNIEVGTAEVAVRTTDASGGYNDTNTADDWRVEDEVTFFGGKNGPPIVTAAVVENAPLNQSDTGDTHTVTIRFNETMDTAVQPTVELSDLASSDTYNTSLANNGAWINGTAWQSEFTLQDDNDNVVSTILIADAQDQYGKMMVADTSNTVTVDTVSPSIANLDPADGSQTTNDQQVITADITDATSGVNESTISVTVTDANGVVFDNVGTDATGISYDGTTVSIDVSAIGETYAQGNVDVTVDAADEAGNDATQGWMFTVVDQRLQPVESAGVNTQSGQLQFTIENVDSTTATAVNFSADATALDPSPQINDGNNPEFQTSGATTDGSANAPGNGNSFPADGTRNALDTNTEIAPGDDSVTVTLRAFQPDVTDNLEYADSAADADLIVTIGLSDGSEQEFYFRKP